MVHGVQRGSLQRCARCGTDRQWRWSFTRKCERLANPPTGGGAMNVLCVGIVFADVLCVNWFDATTVRYSTRERSWRLNMSCGSGCAQMHWKERGPRAKTQRQQRSRGRWERVGVDSTGNGNRGAGVWVVVGRSHQPLHLTVPRFAGLIFSSDGPALASAADLPLQWGTRAANPVACT